MRIHIGESDKWHGKPLHEAIVMMLRKENFPGATVLRGVGGFGVFQRLSHRQDFAPSQDLPSWWKWWNPPSESRKSFRNSTKWWRED